MGRNISIFVKIMFELKKSHTNMLHKLKSHIRSATSILLMSQFFHLLTSLMI